MAKQNPKELRPVRETDSDFADIEKEIIRIFKEEIYIPLINIVMPSRIKNSIEDLIDAIQSGKIYYENGRFIGKINSSLSRELRKLGARWDRRQGSFSIPPARLPGSIQQAISTSFIRFEQVTKKIDQKLASVSPKEIADKIKVSSMFEKSLFKTEEKLKKTMKNITVTPKLTDSVKEKISEEYSNNMKLYIVGWTEEEILKLRAEVKASALKGARYENLIDDIKKSYGVSQNKAKFLARQETNLLLSKFKQEKYVESGIKQYRWGCVKMPHQAKNADYHEGDVRYYHAKNEGEVFDFDKPPIVNKNGDRKHPGEDYNCRCFMIPIVKF